MNFDDWCKYWERPPFLCSEELTMQTKIRKVIEDDSATVTYSIIYMHRLIWDFTVYFHATIQKNHRAASLSTVIKVLPEGKYTFIVQVHFTACNSFILQLIHWFIFTELFNTMNSNKRNTSLTGCTNTTNFNSPPVPAPARSTRVDSTLD